MTWHRRFHRLLARRAELSASEEAALARHLVTCAACRQTANDYERDELALRSYMAHGPHPRVREHVLWELDRPLRPVHGERRPAWGRVRGTIGAAAAGAALAALLVVVWLAGGRAWPGNHPTPGARYMASCRPAHEGWSLAGPCTVISSPAAFQRPGVQFSRASMEWVKQTMHRPHYIVRKGTQPPAILGAQRGVSYSRIAYDPGSNSSLYAVSAGYAG